MTNNPLLLRIKQQSDQLQKRIQHQVNALSKNKLSKEQQRTVVRSIEADMLKLELTYRRAVDTCNVQPNATGCQMVLSPQVAKRYRALMQQYKAQIAKALDKSAPQWRSYLNEGKSRNWKKILYWTGVGALALWLTR